MNQEIGAKLNQIPASTKWTLDAVGDTGRSSVNAVYMIVSREVVYEVGAEFGAEA